MGHEFDYTMAQFSGRGTWIPQSLQNSQYAMVSSSPRLAITFYLFTIYHAARARSYPKCH